MTKRAGAPDAPPLSAAVIVILLSGWGAKPPAGASDRDDDVAFALFQENTQGVVRLWLRHRDFLLEEARRRGMAPSWTVNGRAVFFGEHCCAAREGRYE